jgi:hypothetical protein
VYRKQVMEPSLSAPLKIKVSVKAGEWLVASPRALVATERARLGTAGADLPLSKDLTKMQRL